MINLIDEKIYENFKMEFLPLHASDLPHVRIYWFHVVCDLKPLIGEEEADAVLYPLIKTALFEENHPPELLETLVEKLERFFFDFFLHRIKKEESQVAQNPVPRYKVKNIFFYI